MVTTKLRPVAAVQDWMRAAEITSGPVFRSVDRHGKARGALTPQSVALTVKRYARLLGWIPMPSPGTPYGPGS